MIFNKLFTYSLVFRGRLCFIFIASKEIIFFFWYGILLTIFIRVYSHLRFILIILELITLITLRFILFIIRTSLLELRFLFLFLCLAVGEAALGLRLLILSSRFQSREFLSFNLNFI